MVASKYIDRFNIRINKKGPDDCWEWTRGHDKSGYGYFYIGEHILAHRFAYELDHGWGSADGNLVLHSCDNPPCCNPKHLFLGTHKDNAQDRDKKGRSQRTKGDECSWAKLTKDDILEIRKLLAEGVIQRRIAEKFKVSPATICYINKNATWNPNKEIRNRGRPKGEECPWTKLYEGEVIKIKELILKGFSQKRIADEFKVSQGTISKIRLGKAWRHI